MPTTLAPLRLASCPATARTDPGAGRDRRLGRVQLQEAIAGDRAVELPAIAAHRVIAVVEIGMVGANDLADDAALDDVADLSRFGIGAHPADAAAHIRVERQIDAAQQNLALLGLGQWR